MTATRRRRVLGSLVVAGAAAVIGAGVMAFVPWRVRAEAPPPAPAPVVTAPITVETLTETASAAGELGYGAADPIESKAPGTVTWLPDVGAVLARGAVVAKADERPIVLLYGALPLYRPLTPGTAGPDVKQFETNLRALGFTGFGVDSTYDDATAAAVKKWQHRLRTEETGTVELTAVVYVPGAVRVAAHTARVGANAAGQLLTYTADTKVVTASVPAQGTSWAVAGAAVSVMLPGGATVAGKVAEVGTEASAPPSQGTTQAADPANATVHVTVEIADQAALGKLDRAPVDIRYTVRSRPDVLTVPVTALLAPIEGGYAVEVVEGIGTRVLAVRTGLFSGGRVEISGTGIAAGMAVRVAS